ncbi:transcription termination factor Rho [Leucobacter sp. USHLN153]|uniref:transcription termination factor Rho n=1 Tax=Leucobacter sp. USHLN153 TaxID=3081268 RepID=UPI0030194B4B
MESNVDNTNPDAAEAAPTRRRASRRVSTAAAAPSAEATTNEAPAAAPAEAAAPAAEAEAPAEAPKKRATRSRKKVEAPEASAAEGAEAQAESGAAGTAADASAEAPAEAPKKRATRGRKKADAPEAAAEVEQAAGAADAAASVDAAAEAPVKRTRRRASAATAAPQEETAAAAAPAEAAAEAPAAPAAGEQAEAPKSARGRGSRRSAKAAADADGAKSEASQAEAQQSESSQGQAQQGQAAQSQAGQTEKQQNGGQQAESSQAAAGSDDGEKSDSGENERSGRNRRGRGRGQKNDAAEANESSDASSEDEGKSGRGQNGSNNQNGPKGGDGKNGDNASRSSRTRQRDRKRRGQGDDLEPEITEDDVLLPIAGILDVLENYAFVRTSGYLPGMSDVYVSLGQVKKYGLRRGDAVVGAIRQPREGDSSSRQKYNAIVKIDTVNGRPVDEQEQRADIADLTPIYPQERLRFETEREGLLGRAIDLVAPMGLGQRAALVLPSRADGTAILSELAEAISANRPDAHLVVVLADAQPEEVTRLQRSVRGEVVAASFDRSAEDQATIAELAVERAKRLAELGHDVIVLVDSLGRLARAYAQAQHAQSRPALDEIDAFALAQVKRLLSAARNLENGGSLTVLATVNAKTGLEADEMLLREVRHIVNSEVRFKKTAPGLVPAVKFTASRTRNADAVLSADEARVLAQLRAELASDDDAQERLQKRLSSSDSNAALLAELQRTGKLS